MVVRNVLFYLKRWSDLSWWERGREIPKREKKLLLSV